jgi:3-oxo-5-alpha-steroid 4-dehydrogenase 1
MAWSMPTILFFVAANACFVYYLLCVVPMIDGYRPTVVTYIGMGMLGLGGCQALQFVTGFGSAPTGKFNNGPTACHVALPVHIAWCTMEQPSVLVPLAMLCNYMRSNSAASLPTGAFFLCMFMAHYIRRSYIYPWLSRGRPYPIHTWVSAMMFTATNGTFQANWLLYGETFEDGMLLRPQTLLGIAIFVFGMTCNINADTVLGNLRKPGETAYTIPCGGLFEYVSGAHFVGEIIEWTGYAIASGFSYAPTVFAAFNWMGIGTRAIATHHWNLEKFGADYPKGRKRLIPLVW